MIKDNVNKIIREKTQTTSETTDMASLRRQRFLVSRMERDTLLSIEVFAQLFIGFTLYALPRASTAVWWSVLLTLPVIALMGALAFSVIKKRGCGMPRPLLVLPILLLLLDMQFCQLALCEMVGGAWLPRAGRLSIAVWVSVFLLLSLLACSPHSVSRLSRFLRVALLLSLAFCFFTSLSYGDAGHLFPVMGAGADKALLCALWLCGGVWCVILPAYMPQTQDSLEILKSRRRLPGLAAAALCAFIAISVCFAQPAYALARPRTWSDRMLLFIALNDSTLSWSLMTLGLSLLLLSSLTGALFQAGALIESLCGKPWPVYIAPLLLLPAGVMGDRGALAVMEIIAPYRALAAAILLGATLLWQRGQKA